jgi:hypothetical protein
MARSPKGLIANTSVPPEEMAQLGMRLEQIGSGVFHFKGPDVRQQIKHLIAHWRQFAGSHIEANPATDGTLDRTAAAKAILAKLQVIECSLAGAERDAASGDLYVVAAYHAMLVASYVHQLAIIDNETPIVAWQESIEGARRGGSLRSAGIRLRNRQMAQEFLDRRGGRLSDTALMVAIGAAEGLKRRASIYAVKSGLEDLRAPRTMSVRGVMATKADR